MNIADAKAKAFAMPLTSLFYSPGPYRFINREFLIITNRTDMDARRTVAPVAKLPVHEVLFVVNTLTDLTLGLGEVVHDHLNPKE